MSIQQAFDVVCGMILEDMNFLYDRVCDAIKLGLNHEDIYSRKLTSKR